MVKSSQDGYNEFARFRHPRALPRIIAQIKRWVRSLVLYSAVKESEEGGEEVLELE